MRKLKTFFTLGLVLLAGAAFAGTPQRDLYVADANGRLEIDGDGKVITASLTTPLGGVEDDVLAQIRQWRFKPVLEAGKPIIAIAHMQLKLVAITDASSKQTRLGFRDIRFVDPPALAREQNKEMRSRMPPPVYPSGALRDGVGADLELLLALDGQGRVINVGVDSALLTSTSRLGEGRQKRYLATFAGAAIKSARGWGMPPSAKNASMVRVPVSFRVHNTGWQRAQLVDVPREPWMLLDTDVRVSILDADGAPTSTRFRFAEDARTAL